MLRKLILNYPAFDGIRVNDTATVVIENGKSAGKRSWNKEKQAAISS